MARLASRERFSFAKLREVKDLPDLIAVQTRVVPVVPRGGCRRGPRATSRRSRTSPVSSSSSWPTTSSTRRSTPRTSAASSDMTYARPLFVTARFMNARTGEIKEQTVFMGDFPMMTDRGTFIINGTERIVVSQLVRSPGVYFGITPDKTSPEKDIVDAKMIPGRGAWLEFEVDKKDIVYVRIDRKRKQPVTVLLKALGFGETDEELLDLITRRAGPARTSRCATRSRRTTPRPSTTRSSTSTASCARASRRRPTRRAALLENLFFNPKRYDHGQGRPAQGRRRSSSTSTRSSRPRSASTSTIPNADLEAGTGRLHADEGRHPRHGLVPGEAARQRRRLLPRRHRPLRQPPGALGRRAHPEPGPRRPLPHGAGRARAHDHPGRRGDHAADADQHPAGGRGDQGVLRLHRSCQPVHGPDEPARRPHPQAPPLGARPRRSVA